MNASKLIPRLATLPVIGSLLIWMIVPLGMTLYFSFLRYNLLQPGVFEWDGFGNYQYFLTDPLFLEALGNTLLLVGWVLVITLVLGTLLAVLLDQKIWGQGIVRLLIIAPFFIMPTVSALVWKNLLMHPVSGMFAYLFTLVGLTPIDWFSDIPLTSVIIIVSWEWLPFATLILFTALQSLDEELKDAAHMDGAGPFSYFFYMVLPHLSRPIAVVVLIEMIFLLTIFAEIFVTTSGGPGGATTTLAYLIYINSLLEFDVGLGSAGGVVAIILANIVAFFLIRLVGKNLDD
ncbi:MAG: sugar ABC transporter permease [Gammaproteobacteria bacterium]|nr:sugar ABC transporter permease [Gammaproteobacteria bacterium]